MTGDDNLMQWVAPLLVAWAIISAGLLFNISDRLARLERRIDRDDEGGGQ